MLQWNLVTLSITHMEKTVSEDQELNKLETWYVTTVFPHSAQVYYGHVVPMMNKNHCIWWCFGALYLMMQWSLVSDAAMVPCCGLSHPCGKTMSEEQAHQLKTLYVTTISPHSAQVCYDHMSKPSVLSGLVPRDLLTRLAAKGWLVAQRLIQWWGPKGLRPTS